MSVRSEITTRPQLPVPAESLVGRVLPVPAGKCRYRDEAFALRVSRVRLDISLWYAGQWVWLEGEDLGQAETARRFAPVLVHVSVFADDHQAAPQRHGFADAVLASRPARGE